MGLNGVTSDYGSGSSMNSSTSWGSQELDKPMIKSQLYTERRKAASFADLVSGRCTLDDVMQEFRMNGFDSPYNPEEEHIWTRNPAAAYTRQQSWPRAGRSPPPPPPAPRARPVSLFLPTPTPMVTEVPAPLPPPGPATPPLAGALSEEQQRVLRSLPDAAVAAVLRHLQRRSNAVETVCRFCKNNGERESFYRSHTLRDARGRVACPVLRAFTCPRCGAGGSRAHTLKYCPLTTAQERMTSTAMMRSVRLASRRHRAAPSPAPRPNYYNNDINNNNNTPALCAHTDYTRGATASSAATEMAPLDPLWAELERKLML